MWTQEQQDAIDARGGSLLVAAAAGSGKTAVLTQRILALCREGASVDRMLVVTFTNAAAAEMRARILAAFSAEADAGDPAFAEQAALVERADICTLHRFCIGVLREHFQAAGVDPSFRLGDEAAVQVLRESALADAIDACYETGDPDFLALTERMTDEEIAAAAVRLPALPRRPVAVARPRRRRLCRRPRGGRPFPRRGAAPLAGARAARAGATAPRAVCPNRGVFCRPRGALRAGCGRARRAVQSL